MLPHQPLALLVFSLNTVVFGYDAGYASCPKQFRSSKRSWPEIPCDFSEQNWCSVPGSAYPWAAVRQFVLDNHGLMRRMYGDERQIKVLRTEIESNDVEYQSESGWNFHDEQLKSYHPKPDKVSSTSSSTTSSSTTTTSTTTTTTTTTTTNNTTTSTTAEPSTEALGNVTDSPITETDMPTTEAYVDTTTVDYEPTTEESDKKEKSQTPPSLFTKTQTTTEAPPMYKLKGVNACPVKEEVVAPFWAKNTRGEELALVNLYPYEQYVHWEKCTFENKQAFCRQGCRCEQQYRLHRLLAYDQKNGCRGIFYDWFKFPSCCICRCYELPNELRLTSRSPRQKANQEGNDIPANPVDQ